MKSKDLCRMTRDPSTTAVGQPPLRTTVRKHGRVLRKGLMYRILRACGSRVRANGAEVIF